MKITTVLIICNLAACGHPSQEPIDYPALARGVGVASFRAGDWDVILDGAKIGFGPAYFCTTAAANTDLCATALAEFADSATVDALDPIARPIGHVHGVTGRMRSLGYDFAISWFPRLTTPAATRGAPGGHSAQFAGRATRAGASVSFFADVDVTPKNQGALAVQGPSIDAHIDSAAVSLTIDFDAVAICKHIDFDDLAKTADASGRVVVAKGSRADNALLFAMTVGAPPTFSWR